MQRPDANGSGSLLAAGLDSGPEQGRVLGPGSRDAVPERGVAGGNSPPAKELLHIVVQVVDRDLEGLGPPLDLSVGDHPQVARDLPGTRDAVHEDRVPVREGRCRCGEEGLERRDPFRVDRRDVDRPLLLEAYDFHGRSQLAGRVEEPVERGRGENGGGTELGQGRPERKEQADQVARVHGRDIERGKRGERDRIVPVVEVAPEPLEPPHGLERLLESFRAPAGGEVPQVDCPDGREEGEPDIGRRGPVRNPLHRLFLVVVGRQPVLRGRDKDLEEAPCPARDRPEKPGLPPVE